ncbi:TraR/DksA family transcriptional regulator [Candidatus Dependentiae bacterium]|nr:TraR/DksA family transcriptional regulator [Candidatus Dependentiae bacterium]
MKQRQAFFEKIKDKLIERQVELTRDIEFLAHDKPTDRQVMDSGDEALSLSLEKLQSSLEKTEIDELHLIDQALQRLQTGEYGVCIDCGEVISHQRLEYYPYAARCIVCQEATEAT